MRKFLLSSLLAALTAPAFAQALTDKFVVTYNDVEVQNNQTIDVADYYDPNIYYDPEFEDPDYVPGMDGYDTTFQLKLNNISGAATALDLNMYVPEAADGFFKLCYGFSDGPGQCLNVKNNVVSASNVEVNEGAFTLFDIDQEGFFDLEPVKLQLDVNLTGSTDIFTVYINFTHQKDITSAVDGVMVDSSAEEYFNLQGLKVAEPQKGNIYIVRKGNKTSKRLF